MTAINGNQNGGFDPEQEAILRNLARSSAPEANMYAYAADGYHGIQANSTVYNDDNFYNENYTYNPANPGLQNPQPLELEAQTLLESLANFEPTPQNTDAQPSTRGDHFASLLEAAATANGQESQMGYGETRRSTRRSVQTGFGFPASPPRNGVGRKTRSQDMQDRTFKSNKRRRTDEPSEDEDQLAREREIWGSEEEEPGQNSTTESDYHNNPPISVSDARAAGVHSAAALFRRPSSASKKYTRPPMSKLFTSLELSPEDFLHLQAAAKAYMLDPDHPERRDCVGSRGRGDTDMVKLKLFGCVKSFLEDEGWGDKCFGDDAPGAAVRKLKWPHMKNKVISVVTPLLRRMVTNERQRQYAVDSRRNNLGNDKKQTPSPPNPNIDPKLAPYHYNIDPSFSVDGSRREKSSDPSTMETPQDTPQSETSHSATAQQNGSQPITSQATSSELQYHINIIHSNKRIRSPAIVNVNNCPGFPSLIQHAHNLIGDVGGLELKAIRVLGLGGLVEVNDDEKWSGILEEYNEHDWLGSDVRIVVEMA